MGEEKDFEREVLDRLIRMEMLVEQVVKTCPDCQSKLGGHDVAIAKIDEAAKSAHKRTDDLDRALKEQADDIKKQIDDIYKKAVIWGATVAGVLEFAFRFAGK